MRKLMGGAAFAAAMTTLALVPAGASAQDAPSADCSTLGQPGKVVTLNLAPLANVTARPCVPTGVASCPADSTYELLKLPSNPLVRLQIASCQAPPA